MARYDIYCVDCDQDYEIHKSYSDLTPFQCPNGHSRIVKKISIPSIQFKGEGFTKRVEDE